MLVSHTISMDSTTHQHQSEEVFEGVTVIVIVMCLLHSRVHFSNLTVSEQRSQYYPATHPRTPTHDSRRHTKRRRLVWSSRCFVTVAPWRSCRLWRLLLLLFSYVSNRFCVEWRKHLEAISKCISQVNEVARLRRGIR